MSRTKQELLAKRYLQDGETEQDMYRRVARHISKAILKYGFDERTQKVYEDQYFDIMNKGYFLPNTPCLVNAGKGNNLSACFTLSIDDSMDSIFDTLRKSSLLFKGGGGVGYNFSNLRPEGSRVQTTNGVSSGPVSFMGLFDKMTEVVKQGGCRRGAMMGILNVDHPDIMKFIEAKDDLTQLTNFNISVGIVEGFMDAVENNEMWALVDPKTGEESAKVSARELFEAISTAAWRTGEPGLIFLDTINAENPSPLADRIVSTNPCVTADTYLYTPDGCRRMGDLIAIEDEYIQVLADQYFSGEDSDTVVGTRPYLTAEVDDIYKVTTEKGYEIRCNATHKFHVLQLDENGDIISHEDKELKDIAIGEVLPLFDGDCDADSNKQHITADGTIFSVHAQMLAARLMACIYVLRKDVFFEEYNDRDGAVKGIFFDLKTIRGKLKDASRAIYEKKTHGREKNYRLMRRLYDTTNIAITTAMEFMEVMRYDNQDKMIPRDISIERSMNKKGHTSFKSALLYKYLDEYFDFNEDNMHSVPAIAMAGNAKVFDEWMKIYSYFNTIFNDDHILFTSAYLDQVKDIQRRLLTFGIISSIHRFRKAREVYNRNIKRLEVDLWNLKLSGSCLADYVSMFGFMDFFQEKAIAAYFEYSEKSDRVNVFQDTVADIRPDGFEPVYCLTQPKNNTVVFNGISTRNCGESPLLSGESCCLGSFNLYKIYRENRPEGVSVHAVDAWFPKKLIYTATRFLDDLIDQNHYPLPEIEKATKLTRKIGLGVMGFADLLAYNGIEYGSNESCELAKAIMNHIREEAYIFSKGDLYADKTHSPNYKDFPARAFDGTWNHCVTSIAPTGSISILAGCSSGIEPHFALSYTRTIMDGTQYDEFSPVVTDFVNRLSKEFHIHEKQADAIIEDIKREKKIVLGNPAYEGLWHYFEHWKTADQIEPKNHLNVMAAFQLHTDLAVSKTINLPQSATLEDVKQAFTLAFRKGCKGITVYRDGCRANQVLSTTATVKESLTTDPDIEHWHKQHVMEHRPDTLHGFTKRIRTGDGDFYLTVNSFDDKPIEIFATPNSNAKESAVNAEALSRVCSLALRYGVPANILTSQLSKVRNQSLLSLPQNIANVLNSLTEVGDIPCPDCKGTLQRIEGCLTCMSCGFSKCG